MAISDNLMLALLAMDAYNRGPSAALAESGASLGRLTQQDFRRYLSRSKDGRKLLSWQGIPFVG